MWCRPIERFLALPFGKGSAPWPHALSSDGGAFGWGSMPVAVDGSGPRRGLTAEHCCGTALPRNWSRFIIRIAGRPRVEEQADDDLNVVAGCSRVCTGPAAWEQLTGYAVAR